jgi:hypothetical protein
MARQWSSFLRFVASVTLATLVLSITASAGSFALGVSRPVSQSVTPECNAVGHRSTADCVRHMHLGATPGHAKASPGQAFKLKVWLHPSLADSQVQVAVQVRSLKSGGKDGPWRSTQVYSGLGSAFGDALGWRTVSAQAPKQKGQYEVETRVSWTSPGAVLQGYSPDSPVASPSNSAVSAPTFLGDGMNCTNSADDENIIEYFNEIQFSDEIEVIVTDTGTAFNVVISCPPLISPTIPSPDFELSMTTADDATSTTCRNQVPIVIPKDQLAAKTIDYCSDGLLCDFDIVLSNRTTLTIYSQTVYQMTMTAGNQTLIPNLEPATLPICNNTLQPCWLNGTCTGST